MSDPEAVVEELLEPHHDEFVRALTELDGRVQYVARARYVEQTLLREVLAENDAAAELARQLRESGNGQSLDLRERLGKTVSRAVEGRNEIATPTRSSTRLSP